MTYKFFPFQKRFQQIAIKRHNIHTALLKASM